MIFAALDVNLDSPVVAAVVLRLPERGRVLLPHRRIVRRPLTAPQPGLTTVRPRPADALTAAGLVVRVVVPIFRRLACEIWPPDSAFSGARALSCRPAPGATQDGSRRHRTVSPRGRPRSHPGVRRAARLIRKVINAPQLRPRATRPGRSSRFGPSRQPAPLDDRSSPSSSASVGTDLHRQAAAHPPAQAHGLAHAHRGRPIPPAVLRPGGAPDNRLAARCPHRTRRPARGSVST